MPCQFGTVYHVLYVCTQEFPSTQISVKSCYRVHSIDAHLIMYKHTHTASTHACTNFDGQHTFVAFFGVSKVSLC